MMGDAVYQVRKLNNSEIYEYQKKEFDLVLSEDYDLSDYGLLCVLAPGGFSEDKGPF